MKISTKISFYIIIITLLISAGSGTMIYRYFSDMIVTQLKLDNEAKLDLVVRDLNHIYEEAYKYGQYVSVNKEVQQYLLKDKNPSVFELFSEHSKIRQSCNELVFLSEHINSIGIVKDEDDIIWTYLPFDDAYTSQDQKKWYQTYIEGGSGKGIFSKPYSFQGRYLANTLISVAFPCRSVDQAGQELGTIVIDINWSTVEQVIRRNQGTFDAMIYVNGDKSVSVGDQELIDQSEYKENEPLICRSNDLKIGGSLTAILDYSYLADSVRPRAMMLVLVLGIMVALIIGILIRVMLNITKPVAILSAAMQKVGEGDLQTHAEIATHDEFEYLGRGFNNMVDQIDRQVKETLQHEKDKHMLEQEVLIAQINPHFIYNTLNTIIHLARKERNGDIITLTNSFIELLQDGIHLSQNKIFSSVEQELRIIQNYMCIQNYRYKDLFLLSISCPDELMEELIPASIIQPLMENALFHGIAPLGLPGKIWLILEEEELPCHRGLKISVMDEGIGITQDQADRILTHEPPEQSGRNHVGLYNVIKRLELLYGTDYTIQITQRDGGGTVVEIVIPLKQEW